MSEPLILKGVQLAYARAIAAIELKFDRHRRNSDDDGDEGAYDDAQAVIRQLTADGDLREPFNWKQRVPLIDLYNFSQHERGLLLDLADNGGVLITRQPDSRFHGLGCGNGGKGAVIVSASHRWKTALTKRGEALVEALRRDKP